MVTPGLLSAFTYCFKQIFYFSSKILPYSSDILAVLLVYKVYYECVINLIKNKAIMKKQITFLCLGFLSLLMFQSCSSDPCGNDKDDFIEKFDALVEKVEKIEYDTEDKNWEAYNEEFKHMIEECYKIHEDDMSSREERSFAKKTAVYYVKTFSGQVNFEKHAAEIGKLLDNNIDEFSNGINAAIKDFKLDIDIDEAELKELIGEFGDDIESLGKKWGKKLEKIIEKE